MNAVETICAALLLLLAVTAIGEVARPKPSLCIPESGWLQICR